MALVESDNFADFFTIDKPLTLNYLVVSTKRRSL